MDIFLRWFEIPSTIFWLLFSVCMLYATYRALRNEHTKTETNITVILGLIDTKLGEVLITSREAVTQAKAAYEEANTVNKKIELVGLQVKDGTNLDSRTKS